MVQRQLVACDVSERGDNQVLTIAYPKDMPLEKALLHLVRDWLERPAPIFHDEGIADDIPTAAERTEALAAERTPPSGFLSLP